MSNINKQALREAAEKATPGRVGDRIDGSGSIKYECHGYDGSLVLRTDHKNMEYGFIGDNSNADELFFRLCVPDVILALLDELEAAEKRIAELERKEQHSDRQSVIDALASSGEEWSDIEEYMQKWDAERAAAAGKGEAS